MELITHKYEIEYIDTYRNGGLVHGFEVIIENTCFYIEYSKDEHDIVTVSYINEEMNTKFDYLSYELKNVCRFMLDLM